MALRELLKSAMTATTATYLITGIASERSLAYAIAQALSENSSNHLILSYQQERFRPRLEEYAQNFGNCSLLLCDVSQQDDLRNLQEFIKVHAPNGLDGLVHAIAFAPADQLDGKLTDCLSKEGFLTAHEISSYSLTALVQATREALCQAGGSVLTLTYLGSERAIPNYNVMGLAKASLEASVRYLAADLGPQGVRVNGISAPPMRTLASSGIKGIRDMVQYCGEKNFLQRGISAQEIAASACFLLSRASSAITGEIIYTDGGFSHSCGIS